MFGKFTKKDKRSDLEKEIHSVHCYMQGFLPDEEEYQKCVEVLERLYKAKSLEKDRKVSPDTIATVIGGLTGTVLVLWFEKANVITSKAFNAVFKGRV